ncbi:MAG TPA: tetratricopeptide repeat protein, partial [Candidatus Latescibacteria bacterium]|nr:tetratricopeptide repeat protein [Candidatus Latescibacterota bacterium]
MFLPTPIPITSPARGAAKPASHLRDVLILMCAATLYQCGAPAQTTLHPISLPPLTPESVSVAEPEVAIADLPSAALADSIRKYRFMSHEAWDKGEIDSALNYFQHLVKYRPDEAYGHYFIGRIHFEKRNYEAAEAALLTAIAQDSLHINANLMPKSFYDADDKPNSAALCLERLLLAKPEDVKKRRELADSYRQQREVLRALSHYRHLAEADSNSIELLELLAVVNEDKDLSKALGWRRRMLHRLRAQSSVGDSPVPALRAQKLETMESVFKLQRRMGKHELAFETMSDLATEDPANRGSYYSRQAELAAGLGWHERRIQALERVVEADPDDLQSLTALAEWYLNQGDGERTRKCLEQGLRVNATDAHLLVLRGDMLVKEGDEEEAIAAY